MKIGIIVYSQTGNTLSIAEKLRDNLIKDNHTVNIEKIEAIRDPKQTNIIKLTKAPDITKYDGIVLATFVEAFSLCPVMIEYLKQLKSLKNKNVTAFVTQFFPYPWMGGNHAIKQLKKCVNNISKTSVINRKNKRCTEMTDQLIKDFTIYFKEV